MKALVKYAPGPGNIEVRDVPEPTPGPGEVMVAVKAAGICGSDLHIYHDDIKLAVNPPVVMGHEFAGVVAQVGEGVTGVQAGQRVTCETARYVCGECLACRTGQYNVCSQKKLIGYAYDGCFANYCVVDAERVHFLPENVDFLGGALTEPLACTVHALLELTQITAGDVAVVTGPGPMGLLSLQVAKAAGAYVIVCGTSQDAQRLRVAQELGADLTLDVETEDAAAIVGAATRGEGADVWVEASGAPAAARLGLELVRRRGQYTQLGLFGRPFELDFEQIAYKEIQVTGSLGQRWTAWTRALDLMARGQVQTRPLVTHVLPITAWEEAFAVFESRAGLKIVLEPVE
jgi:L-iditol 2-dehydrogenase